VIDGYGEFLRVVQKNLVFRGVIASKIGKLEEAIKEMGEFSTGNIIYTRDTLHQKMRKMALLEIERFRDSLHSL
jgi:hypothetical protein